ncbi:MAG: glycosyltransferase [Pararhodobacter sp.]
MEPLRHLASALWQAPLAEPATPGLALAGQLDGALDYPQALAHLRALTGWHLPASEALEKAMSRWPWSIDLALLAVDESTHHAPAGTEAALAGLAARITAQNRRHAAYARAAWALGRADDARAFLAAIDPASQTAAEDRACRCELALHEADWPAAEADLAALADDARHHPRLRVLHAHARHGAPGLAALAATLDDDPALAARAAQIFELALAERDYPLARMMAARLRARHGPASAPARDSATLLALDANKGQAALDLLAPDLAPEPWQWTARQHIRWLRAQQATALQSADPQAVAPHHQRAMAHAEAALRLHPGHAVLRGLWLGWRELTEDWRRLEAEMRGPLAPGESPLQRATQLDRLGRHREALALLDTPLPQAPRAMRAAQARRHAESALLAGDPPLAETALNTAESLPLNAAQRTDLAMLRAEWHLWQFQAAAAEAALAPLDALCPQRMGLWLLRARAAFLQGDFAASEAALQRFRSLKQAQTEAPVPLDLRDRITADALDASQTLPPLDPAQPIHQTIARCTARVLCAAPGLAAWTLANGLRQGAWPLGAWPLRTGNGAVPTIPRQLLHYWEGAPNGAVQRSLDAWAAHHPGFAQTVFTRESAARWLGAHAPHLVALFERQTLPATRADLFRIAWLVQEGGIYADVDEFPRAPVTDWLSDATAVFCIEAGYGTVANNFIAATPGLPLLARMLARIEANLATSASPYPWWDSGPAPLSQSALESLATPDGGAGLRLLWQAEYCARVSTNLPFPHKRGAFHWR